MQQQQSLQELLTMQEVERQKLREEFQMRQQFLVQEIIGQFPGLQVTNSNREEYSDKHEEQEYSSARVVRNLEKSFSRQDSCISNVEDKLENISVTSTISTTYEPKVPKRVIRSETFKKSQEKSIKIP